MKIYTERVIAHDLPIADLIKIDHWQRRTHSLIYQAALDGVVITVSNPPNQPLAMGNYDLVVSARIKRGVAK